MVFVPITNTVSTGDAYRVRKVNEAVAIIIQSIIAVLGLAVKDRLIVGSTISIIRVAVVVVIRIAGVSHTVTIEIVLFGIGLIRAIVTSVVNAITVFIPNGRKGNTIPAPALAPRSWRACHAITRAGVKTIKNIHGTIAIRIFLWIANAVFIHIPAFKTTGSIIIVSAVALARHSQSDAHYASHQ